MKEDTSKWKEFCVHGLEDLLMLKCPHDQK